MIWHDMVKVNYFLHSPFLVETVLRARVRANRFRRSLTASTTRTMTRNARFLVGIQGADVEETSSLSTKFCACCNQAVALPCWVCLYCGV